QFFEVLYSGFSRTRSNMPGAFAVAQTVEEKQLHRPWTYVRPFVSSLTAVDQASMLKNEAHPDQRIGNLVFYPM
ncbi:MAG: hypothetical protein Q4P24_04915, partial [Rhodobacterales bacterium]|nr:hypothetical protein [Rhodobacterales bacterium]